MLYYHERTFLLLLLSRNHSGGQTELTAEKKYCSAKSESLSEETMRVIELMRYKGFRYLPCFEFLPIGDY